jgi:hypothetical protein
VWKVIEVECERCEGIINNYCHYPFAYFLRASLEFIKSK